MHQKLNISNILGQRQTSAYAIGTDFVKVFTFGKWSTGVVTLRSEDLPNHERGRSYNNIPVMIIPGPKQPPHLDLMFAMIVKDFMDFGPGQPGLHVTPHAEVEGKVVARAAFLHNIILSGVYADSPARCKVGNFMGSASAYLACNWCWFSGTKVPSSKATVFLGYSRPHQITVGFRQGLSAQIGVNDEARRITHAEHVARAAAAKADHNLAPYVGCHGPCVFVDNLFYLDYNDMFLLPIGHTFLLGVLKDFSFTLLGREKVPGLTIQSKLLNKVKSVEKEISLTSDYGRPFTSFVESAGE